MSEPLYIYTASAAIGCLKASAEACKAPSNRHAIVLGTLLNIWQYKIFYWYFQYIELTKKSWWYSRIIIIIIIIILI